MALRASWKRRHLCCIPPGLRAWPERLDADCMGHSHHSLGSNNFRKVLLRSRLLVPQGPRHSQSFKYLVQPRITPIVLASSWGTQEDPEGDESWRWGLALAYGWCFFEDFSIWLLQEGPPCGKGGAAAWVLREQRVAEGGAWWVGDSQGGPCFLVKVLLCVSGMCSLAHWALCCGRAYPGPARGFLAPSPALAILGTGCVQAWGGMGNPAQTRVLGRCLDRHSRVLDL